MLNKNHVGIKESLSIVKKESDKEKTVYISEYYDGKKNGSYKESEIHIIKYKDGSLSFINYDSGEGWISLYPKQVEHLKKILKEKL